MNARPVTLLDVLGAAQSGRVALAPESAGYLALGLADALATSPRAPEATEIVLSDSGQVDVLSRTPASDRAAEASARALLGQLLGVAGSSAPALSAAARKAPTGGAAHLVRDIEAALIPVNRAAAKRALARLHRETSRVRGEAVEIAYTPSRSTESLDRTAVDGEYAEGTLEQDASIVVGELSMPLSAEFEPSIALPAQGSAAAPGDADRDLSHRKEPPPSDDGTRGRRGDRGFQPKPPRSRSRIGTYLLAVLVVAGLFALVWVYLQHPELITGHR
jgi:hypothetical protein